MIKKIIFKRIKFYNFKSNDLKKILNKKGLFVFPSAPGLASIELSKNYYEALKKSDIAFFDSGLFVILLRVFKNIKVNKFSGYKFLKFFFKYLRQYNNKTIFSIDPNINFSKSNKKYLRKLNLKNTNIYNYVAPNYNPNFLFDNKLLIKVKKLKPEYILINIGGGVQEVLGLYLKNNLNYKPTIICTGGAISFFTGDQAPINDIIDKFYLGWLIRFIYNPKIFFSRYLEALKLFVLVAKNKTIALHE